MFILIKFTRCCVMSQMKLKRLPVALSMRLVSDKVLELKDLWESRSNDIPFFTIGKAAYLDGNAYTDRAKELNKILIKQFGPLYTEIQSVFESEFKEPVGFNPSIALPGFHIFPSDPKLLSVAGNWHIDTPHLTLNLGHEDTWAFTLPIQLPSGGGGMESRESYHAYEVGQMILHKGNDLHRIANFKDYKPNEYRITLQGHIVRVEGKLVMFW